MLIYPKNQLHPSLLSWDIAQILQTCYLEYIGEASPCPPRLMVSTYKKVWCLSAYKKIFVQTLQRYYILAIFGNFGACLTPPACRKLWCLFHAKKWYLFLTSFLEYFKDFAKLLIWVLWACPSKAITQRKLWCLSSKQKSNLISYIF